jgi:hypothetical protein
MKAWYKRAEQCSAVQCSAVQCSAVQCSAVQCSAVQCSAVQCSAVATRSSCVLVWGLLDVHLECGWLRVHVLAVVSAQAILLACSRRQTPH